MPTQMDTIKQLFEKAGLSPETSKSLCESMQNFMENTKAKYEQEYKDRTERAKQVCLEEYETYKNDLARRVQLFLEAKTNTIENTLAKQIIMREGKSSRALSEIKAILEGVPAAGNNNELIAKLKKAINESKQLKTTLAQKDKTIQRHKELCETVTRRNRQLETLNVTLEKRLRDDKPSINENRQQPPRRGKTSTTRRTLVENQNMRTLDNPTNRNVSGSDDTPAGIAAQIEDEV